MTMCFKHNRYFRIGMCPICVEDVERQIQLEHEIRMQERQWSKK